MDNATRKAVGLAFEAGYGDRLTEIAQEHIQLATMGLDCRDSADHAIIDKRIKALRKERDEILAKFVGEEDVT